MRNWLVVLAMGMAACSGDEGKDGDRVDAVLALDGDAAAGKTVFEANCVSCHAASGLGVDDPTAPGIGQNLTEASGETDADAEFADIIINGKEQMIAFGDTLDDQQIADVIAYIHDGLIQ